jgi:L-amino acid N-acyltransferase YncA
MTTIRSAREDDLPGILKIYNEIILNTTAVYQYEPHTLEMRTEWFDAKMEAGYPVFVAESDGVIGRGEASDPERAIERKEVSGPERAFERKEASGPERAIVGFSTFGPFRAWQAYKYTVENSVYVDATRRGQGIGKLLLAPLIGVAREMDLHAIIAGIDATNSTSVKLHTFFGFEEVAHFRQVGYKFGRWLDLKFFELLLEGPKKPVDG